MKPLIKVPTLLLLAVCVAFQSGPATADNSDIIESALLKGTWKRLQGGSATEYEGTFFDSFGSTGKMVDKRSL